MATNAEIGSRVRESLNGAKQVALAEQVRMTPDAMSRALSGQRGFSSVELAGIADALGVDVYWLITGESDPMQVRVAARHSYDRDLGLHTNPGREDDERALAAVELAYRQAYGDQAAPETPRLPKSPRRIRELLGEDFVRKFADRVEERLNVDVVRLSELTTAYSLAIGNRGVIALPTKPYWFRNNSNLAHELAHLALGHHEANGDDSEAETSANGFASELLLPEKQVKAADWQAMSQSDVVLFVWEAGVSTAFLKNRLENLHLTLSPDVRSTLRKPTVSALHCANNGLAALECALVDADRWPNTDSIAERTEASSQRRFPSTLVAAHQHLVEQKRVNPATLAWMLGCRVEDLYDDEVEIEPSNIRDGDFSVFDF